MKIKKISGVSRYTNLIKSLWGCGYSMEDIQKIIEYRAASALEKEEISRDCELEGYPSRGSNYELRAEEVDNFYSSLEEEIHAKYS